MNGYDEIEKSLEFFGHKQFNLQIVEGIRDWAEGKKGVVAVVKAAKLASRAS